MSHSHLVLVRPDPRDVHCNHPADIQTAIRVSKARPCWVYLLGPVRREKGEVLRRARQRRQDEMRRRLHLNQIAKDGLQIFAPESLIGADDVDALAGALARYLADLGLLIPLKERSHLEVHLPSDLDPPLLAAVVEAASVYPRTSITLGEQQLKSHLRWELRRDLFQSPPPESSTDLTGSTPAMEAVRRKISRYAEHAFPVLVIGETGTGKELVAKMLHEQSGRSGRFMAQNAAQLPTELADSLLFGHVQGAFTGAASDRPGRIKESNGGTFFLDETFNLSPLVQGKLLRALNRVNEGIVLVEPVGSTRPPDVVHARLVVSALGDPRIANSDPGTAAMRTDLFYRVSAGVIRLPPLREMLDDLPELCRSVLRRISRQIKVSDSGIEALRSHDWPGNIRELQLILLRAWMDGPPDAVVLDGGSIRSALASHRLPSAAQSLALPCDLALELKRIEVATMRAAMRQVGSNASEAGRRIGLGKNGHNFRKNLERAEAALRKKEQRHAD